MRYIWMDEYLLKKKGVTKDLQPVWNWIRYHVGGRMFAAVCLNRENQPYYADIICAEYMNILSPAIIRIKFTGIPSARTAPYRMI